MEPRKSFLLRINPELWRELEAWAQTEMRSVNGQIEYLLQQAVVRRRRSEADEGLGEPGTPRKGPRREKRQE
jgi:hypothetical protein